MINNDRIVPIQKIDLLSMYGTMLALATVNAAILASTDIEGDFSVSAAGTYLASQPVKSLDFAAGAATGTVYFVAAYDFAGFTVNGAAVATDVAVNADGVTLYKAALASGKVTVTAITPVVAAQ